MLTVVKFEHKSRFITWNHHYWCCFLPPVKPQLLFSHAEHGRSCCYRMEAGIPERGRGREEHLAPKRDFKCVVAVIRNRHHGAISRCKWGQNWQAGLSHSVFNTQTPRTPIQSHRLQHLDWEQFVPNVWQNKLPADYLTFLWAPTMTSHPRFFLIIYFQEPPGGCTLIYLPQQ